MGTGAATGACVSAMIICWLVCFFGGLCMGDMGGGWILEVLVVVGSLKRGDYQIRCTLKSRWSFQQHYLNSTTSHLHFNSLQHFTIMWTGIYTD